MHIVKVPKELLEAHECKALVITCMDFRFWEATLGEFVKKNIGIERFDIITIPGACKGLAERNEMISEYIKYVIQLSQEKHRIKKVIIVHHGTCGAYNIDNPKEELEAQGRDLRDATETLSKLFKRLEFHAFFAQKGSNEIVYIPCVSFTRT